MAYQHINVTEGQKVTIENGKLNVPSNPIIGFIEGDGTGPEIWSASRPVLDAAVQKAYGDSRKIAWTEIFAGEKANNVYNETVWLPQETVEFVQEHLIAIKGPLTTPIGGGIRSINVALRQQLDLYACIRPVQWFEGVPTPVKHPENVNMMIFRENTEDIYAGIEWSAESEEAKAMLAFLEKEYPKSFSKIRFPASAGIGIKPVSREGTERLVAAALEFAIDNDLPTVSLVHKGNIMKFTEGGFRDWGYAYAKATYGAVEIDGGPWLSFTNPKNGKTIVVNDVIADNFLQQILLHPKEYSVVATLNLNGDYISDALAAQVGGIGISPGANINYNTGHAIFEATHGTAPKYAGKDAVNPSSVILSGEMLLRYLGWTEAADLIINSLSKTIAAGTVTFDFHRPIVAEGGQATLLKCSEFGQAMIANM